MKFLLIALASMMTLTVVVAALSGHIVPFPANSASTVMAGTGGILGVIVALVVGLGLYFLPTLVGAKKRNAGAIFALNLLLGWTLLGWIAALVWALTQDAKPTVVIAAPSA